MRAYERSPREILIADRIVEQTAEIYQRAVRCSSAPQELLFSRCPLRSKSDRSARCRELTLWARTELMHCNKIGEI